ncbi:hypothetical protein C1H46_037170 [Malus baccata]|uniref:Uncharacterized protein n=1 Tax=Malus baccata TaxID=106549 RepID=A0A540KSU8_MALBA|nr:hypothetical protein C1H46_037170 [Malus baccata]
MFLKLKFTSPCKQGLLKLKLKRSYLVTPLWYLLKSSPNQINVQWKLRHGKKRYWQASDCVNRKGSVFELIFKHEKMSGAKRNQHGSYRHEQ